MAEKAASIKVNLKGDQAKSEIRGLKDDTKRAAGEMGSALQGALSTGLKGGTDALKGAFSSIKSVVMSIGGLVGGLGVAEITKQALEANSKFGDLSFGIRAAGGSMKDAATIQKQLQKGALETAQDSFKMVDAFEGIRRETGSLDYARGSIDTVATAARGAHKDLGTMAGVAGTLNEKFGITAEELPDALADVVGLSEKGGVGFEDMADKLGLIGAFAKEAGLQGRAGFGQMVGMLNLADNANGSFKKGITAVGGLLEQLGNNVGKNKIGAALGISMKDLGGNAGQQIEAIMKATKGQKAGLEKAFGGEQLKLLVDLGKTYGAAFDSTKGDVKTKTAAAVGAVRDAFESAGKSTLTFADIQKEAASEMNEAPQKLAQAKEKLLQAFSSDKVQAAINKIIDKLPALADFIAKIVGMVADNPAAAGAAALGGTFAKGAIESIIVGAFKTGGTAAAASIGGAMTSGGGPLITALGGFGPAVGIFALAAAAFVAASLYQAKKDQEKRDAEAADAQKMLKGKAGPMGGAYQAAGALEAATGIEFDPNTAISDDTAGRATGNQDQHDKAMEERLMAKAKGNADMLKFGNKLAQNHPEWFMNDTNAQGVSPGANTGPLLSGSQPVTGGSSKASGPSASELAQANASALAGKKLQVHVVNAKDIGGSGGTGGGPTGKGWALPGFLVRQ